MNGTDVLASKLVELIDIVKAASPKVWEVYLYQARLDAYAAIVQIVLGYTVFAALLWRLKRADNDDEVVQGLLVVVIAVMVISSLVVVTTVVPNIMTGLANPSYQAIQLMLGGVQ